MGNHCRIDSLQFKGTVFSQPPYNLHQQPNRGVVGGITLIGALVPRVRLSRVRVWPVSLPQIKCHSSKNMAHLLKCAFEDLNLFSWYTMGEQKLTHLRLITDDADSRPLWHSTSTQTLLNSTCACACVTSLVPSPREPPASIYRG